MKSSGRTAELVGDVVPRAFFRVYRRILSPIIHSMSGTAAACRFQPTCSEYAAIAIRHHGIVRGGALALRRMAKCHPFHAPAFDPVPGTSSGRPVSMQSCAPPVTIETAEFRPMPAAGARSLPLPYEPR